MNMGKLENWKSCMLAQIVGGRLEESDDGRTDASGGTIAGGVADNFFERLRVVGAGGLSDKVGCKVFSQIVGGKAEDLFKALVGDEEVASSSFAGCREGALFVTIESLLIQVCKEVVD